MRFDDIPLRACRLAMCAMLAAWLAACGGGDPDTTRLAGAPPGNGAPLALQIKASDEASERPLDSTGPGLVPGPLAVVDATPRANYRLVSVTPLAQGGYAVAWAVQAYDASPPVWTVWVQRHDRDGQPAGARIRLPYTSDDSLDFNLAVLGDGRIALVFVARQPAQPVEGEVQHITINSVVYTRSGVAEGTARILDEAYHTHRVDPPFPLGYGGIPLMEVAPDGSYFAAWRSHGTFAPSWRVQRLGAQGQPLGWIHHFGVSQVAFNLRLTAPDEGGWVAQVETQSATAGRRYTDIIQIDVPRPLGMPLVETLPAGSFLLDLKRHGSVLFTGQHGDRPVGIIDPHSLHFDQFGREQPPASLPALPTRAVALRGGDYVAMWAADSGTFAAQRHTPRGEKVGDTFTVEVSPAWGQFTSLTRGGMAAAWIEFLADGSRLVTQRFTEPRRAPPPAP